MIKAGTDATRPKDLKMQVIINKEINSIEKLVTNLELTKNRHIRWEL